MQEKNKRIETVTGSNSAAIERDFYYKITPMYKLC